VENAEYRVTFGGDDVKGDIGGEGSLDVDALKPVPGLMVLSLVAMLMMVVLESAVFGRLRGKYRSVVALGPRRRIGLATIPGLKRSSDTEVRRGGGLGKRERDTTERGRERIDAVSLAASLRE
jgi:hypothetical protein